MKVNVVIVDRHQWLDKRLQRWRHLVANLR